MFAMNKTNQRNTCHTVIFWIVLCKESCASEAEPADSHALIQQHRSSLWITENHIDHILSFNLCNMLVSESIEDLIDHCSMGREWREEQLSFPPVWYFNGTASLLVTAETCRFAGTANWRSRFDLARQEMSEVACVPLPPIASLEM